LKLKFIKSSACQYLNFRNKLLETNGIFDMQKYFKIESYSQKRKVQNRRILALIPNILLGAKIQSGLCWPPIKIFEKFYLLSL